MSKPVHNWSLNVNLLKRHLHDVFGFGWEVSELLVLGFIEEVIEALERGEEIDLGPEFGKFYLSIRKERRVDPVFMRGETDITPANLEVKFAPGKELMNRTANSTPVPYKSPSLFSTDLQPGGTKRKG